MTNSKRKHPGPSAESLREIPEVDLDNAIFMKGRGPEARANAFAYSAAVRGRPRKGEQAAGSQAKSIRLPDATWAELEREAKAHKISLHQLLRIIVARHVYTTNKVPPMAKATAKRRARKAA